MSERREIRPTPEKKEVNRLMFGFVENLHDRAMEIREASFSGNHDKTIQLLNDRQVVENMVVRKGKGSYLKIIDGSIDTIYKEITGKTFGEAISPEAVVELIKHGVDPVVVAELANTYYHRKDNKKAVQLAEVLVKQDVGPLVQANAYNCLASVAIRQQKAAEAGDFNRQAFAVLKNSVSAEGQDNAVWQMLKVRHGLLFDRATKTPKHDMEEQFLDIAEERAAMGDILHVGRTYLDVAKLMVKLKQVEKARVYIDQAMEGLTQVGYENALVEAEQIKTKLK